MKETYQLDFVVGAGPALTQVTGVHEYRAAFLTDNRVMLTDVKFGFVSVIVLRTLPAIGDTIRVTVDREFDYKFRQKKHYSWPWFNFLAIWLSLIIAAFFFWLAYSK